MQQANQYQTPSVFILLRSDHARPNPPETPSGDDWDSRRNTINENEHCYKLFNSQGTNDCY